MQLVRYFDLCHFFNQILGFSCIINWGNSSDSYPLPLLIVVLILSNADTEKVRNPCCLLQFLLISSLSILKPYASTNKVIRRYYCNQAQIWMVFINGWDANMKFYLIQLISCASNHFLRLLIENWNKRFTTCIRNLQCHYVSATSNELIVLTNLAGGLVTWWNEFNMHTLNCSHLHFSGTLHTSSQIPQLQ